MFEALHLHTTEIVTVAASIFGSAAVAALLTRFVGKEAAVAGTMAASMVHTEIAHIASPGLRAAIENELHALSLDPQAAEATVVQAAQTILVRIAPAFPAATLIAVTGVIGQFARAFIAGLETDPQASVVEIVK